jgi:plasmid stabilization system protein ParE
VTRSVVFSVTARDQLRDLLTQGISKFGPRVVAEKRDRVYAVIDNHLAHFPGVKQPDQELGLVVYPVSRTPFSVLYDYDDQELRVHFVIHSHSDLSGIDPMTVVW